MKDTVLYIVVPVYKDAEVIKVTCPLFLDQLFKMRDEGLISDKSRVLFVDDGSGDDSWDMIKQLTQENELYVKGICLSRNRGHQNAVTAGLLEVKDMCDVTITIDDDGQDDIGAMTQMMKEFDNGCEIVYGVRSSRKKDTWFKRTTAQSFYKLMNNMGAETVYNHADYRLVSSRVLKHFADFEEVNIFLRGMFPLVGFRSTCVEYERAERIAGKSHYPLSKMMKLAIEGITSLSTKPITLITGFGLFTALLGMIGIIWAIVMVILQKTVDGWASLACITLFMGGVQLLSLGIIGEYVGKIYMESKRRPRYIISDRTWEEDK